jgi:hypothetical protein
MKNFIRKSWAFLLVQVLHGCSAKEPTGDGVSEQAHGHAMPNDAECFVCAQEAPASPVSPELEVVLAATRKVARQMLFGRGRDDNLLVNAAMMYAVTGGGQMGDWADRIDSLTSEAQIRFALDKFGRELTSLGLLGLGLGSAQAAAVIDGVSGGPAPARWVVLACTHAVDGVCSRADGSKVPCLARPDVALCDAGGPANTTGH